MRAELWFNTLIPRAPTTLTVGRLCKTWPMELLTTFYIRAEKNWAQSPFASICSGFVVQQALRRIHKLYGTNRWSAGWVKKWHPFGICFPLLLDPLCLQFCSLTYYFHWMTSFFVCWCKQALFYANKLKFRHDGLNSKRRTLFDSQSACGETLRGSYR